MSNDHKNSLSGAWDASVQQDRPNTTAPWMSQPKQQGGQSAREARGGGEQAREGYALPQGQRLPQRDSAPQPWAPRPQPMPQQENSAAAVAPRPHGAVVAGQHGAAPIGKIRDTGICILLFIVTFGFYGLYWNCVVHREMKRHTGSGFGGLAAFILFWIPLVIEFLTPSEVGRLYHRANRQAPVSGAAGFWFLVPVVGGLIWFVKINGALNDYWRAQGAGAQQPMISQY